MASKWGRNPEEEAISKFNEASFQMLRGHTIQDLMNRCKLNLKAWNEEYSEWNYNIVFLLLNNLFSETSGKLGDTELKTGKNFKRAIENFIQRHPIQKKVRRLNHTSSIVDTKALNVLSHFLFEYELLIREFRETHGFSSPNIEDDEGL